MKRWRIAFGVLLACVTLFILANAFMNYESSHTSSDKVADLIQGGNSESSEEMKTIVRKIAHIVEYFALGASAVLFCLSLSERWGQFCGLPLFYTLFVAVCDEHIQSFSDRTSSTGDVLLDFVGSLVGIAAVHLALLLIRAVRTKREVGK